MPMLRRKKWLSSHVINKGPLVGKRTFKLILILLKILLFSLLLSHCPTDSIHFPHCKLNTDNTPIDLCLLQIPLLASVAQLKMEV